jgi:capsular polysaccharide biosynthesis protein
VSQPQPTARRQLDFLKRQAWFILLVTVVAVVVAAAVTLTKPKVYRAHTSIVIGQAGGIFQPQFGNVFQPFTQTMSSLLKSEIVAETVIRDLNLDKTPKSLLSDVKVSTTPNSAVLQVTVDSTDRSYAVRVLRRMASVFTSLVEEKLGGTPKTPGAAGALPPITATVFDPAHASSTRSRRSRPAQSRSRESLGLPLAWCWRGCVRRSTTAFVVATRSRSISALRS